MVIVNHSTIFAIAALGEAADSNAAEGVLRLTKHFGHIGVAFFFVISGYCIANSCENSDATIKASLMFLFRRFRRVYPTFWICWFSIGLLYILLSAINSLQFLDRPSVPAVSPLSLKLEQCIGNLTLTENWRHEVFGGELPEMIVGQMWTLCYEEQFYLFAFGTILLPRRFLRSCFGMLALYLLVVCSTTFNPQSVPFVRAILVLARENGPLIQGTVLDIHFLEFFAGVIVFWSINGGGRIAKLTGMLGLLALLSLFLLEWFGSRASQFERISSFGFAAFLIAVHFVERPLARSKLMVPLNWCGVRCYSLYLSHVVVVTVIGRLSLELGIHAPLATLFLVVPLCVVASLFVGDLVFRYAEAPFQVQGPHRTATNTL